MVATHINTCLSNQIFTSIYPSNVLSALGKKTTSMPSASGLQLLHWGHISAAQDVPVCQEALKHLTLTAPLRKKGGPHTTPKIHISFTKSTHFL